MEDIFELQPEPTATPEESSVVEKKVSKKKKPCKDCPDYSQEDLLREKILVLKSKGFNDNQVAAMLMIHKQYVESIK